MLYWLTNLSDGGDFFNLFRYITFRAGGAFFTALIFGFMFGRPLIDLLRRKQKKGQPIRDDGPQNHFSKAGTPTMGGLLILAGLLVGTLLWARLDNGYVWIVLLVTMGFAAIGFADDYAKVTKQHHAGLSGRIRLLIGLCIAAGAGIAATLMHPDALSNQLALPFLKDTLINLGIFFVPFSVIVILGAANAVNVVLRGVGHFKVDDKGQVFYIKAACRYVGGDQDADVALFKRRKGFESLALGAVAVVAGGGVVSPRASASGMRAMTCGFLSLIG